MSINATLFVQAIVFAILVWFTMKFVWPPIATALDERAQKIAQGLAAAENAKLELSNAHQQVEKELAKTRDESTKLLADAERRAQVMVEEAKFMQAVVQAIGDLPEREQMVMSLYYVEELNLKEIGEVLGVSESRVSQILSTVVKKLRSQLQVA